MRPGPFNLCRHWEPLSWPRGEAKNRTREPSEESQRSPDTATRLKPSEASPKAITAHVRPAAIPLSVQLRNRDAAFALQL